MVEILTDFLDQQVTGGRVLRRDAIYGVRPAAPSFPGVDAPWVKRNRVYTLCNDRIPPFTAGPVVFFRVLRNSAAPDPLFVPEPRSPLPTGCRTNAATAPERGAAGVLEGSPPVSYTIVTAGAAMS